MFAEEVLRVLSAEVRRILLAVKGREFLSFDLREILVRVNGDIDAWASKPQEVEHQEVIGMQDALLPRAPDGLRLFYQGGQEVGRRPSQELDLQRVLRSSSAPDGPKLTFGEVEALMELKARDVADLLRTPGLQEKEREHLRRMLDGNLAQAEPKRDDGPADA